MNSAHELFFKYPNHELIPEIIKKFYDWGYLVEYVRTDVGHSFGLLMPLDKNFLELNKLKKYEDPNGNMRLTKLINPEKIKIIEDLFEKIRVESEYLIEISYWNIRFLKESNRNRVRILFELSFELLK